jgi:hypothetical protein
MERQNFFTPSAKAILHEYSRRATLQPQDVIKCFLRIYSTNVSPAYDKRVHLWNARPGDVVYIDGVFSPLLSRFSIDDGDKHWKCVHIRERESHSHLRVVREETRRSCDRQCRKWYATYRKENGKTGIFYPDFDGLTTIQRDDIERTLKLLRHRNRKALRTHFTVTEGQRKTDELFVQLRRPLINKRSLLKTE